MKRLCLTALVLAAFTSACGSGPTPTDPTPAPAAPVEVQLLAFNDFHGNLEPPSGRNGQVFTADGAVEAGGVEYLATWVEKLRAPHGRTLVVAAGDNIGATPLISGAFHDEPTIEALGLVGLMLTSVGNHEFDEGWQELVRMQKGGCHPKEGCFGGGTFKGAAFQYLAANVLLDNSGETVFPPYVIKRFEGIPVAFVGMTLEGTPAILTANGKRGLVFKDEADTLNALVPKLRAEGAEAIVVLLHEGGMITGRYDGCEGISGKIVKLVSRFDKAVDIVVTGHTHAAYVCEIDGRLVTSAMHAGRLLTDIRFELDPVTHDVVKRSAKNIIVRRDVAKAPALTALVDKWKTLVAPVESRVVGTIAADLTRQQSPLGESVLGGVVADAQLFAEQDASAGRAELALMNAGGVRADLVANAASGGEKPGEVTYGEVFAVQPFVNPLVTMTLTGAQLESIFESQFRGSHGTPKVLQVSHNVKIGFDPDGPEGDRIDPKNVSIDGKPLDLKRGYRVVMNEYMAGGGDAFDLFKEGTDRVIGITDVDALELYLRKHPKLAPHALGRLVKVTR